MALPADKRKKKAKSKVSDYFSTQSTLGDSLTPSPIPVTAKAAATSKSSVGNAAKDKGRGKGAAKGPAKGRVKKAEVRNKKRDSCSPATPGAKGRFSKIKEKAIRAEQGRLFDAAKAKAAANRSAADAAPSSTNSRAGNGTEAHLSFEDWWGETIADAGELFKKKTLK